MKRILSAILTVAMLASMLAMAVAAYDEDVYNSITNENVMSFKVTDTAGNEKTNFKAGETIWITANMDSIWGDPTIEDDVKGFEGNVLPGAYGMAAIASCLVFPTDTFTPKAGKDIKSLDSTIANSGIDPTTEEAYELNITKTTLSDAKSKGMYTFITESDTFNGDEDQYVFFTGSGLLCRWILTVNADAADGTYKLPIGAYKWSDKEEPKYNFFGKGFDYVGHSDSQLNDRAVKFMSPTNEYVNNDPTQGAYITIQIGEAATAEDIAAAEAFDAMVNAIDTNLTALGHAVKIDAVNYEGLYTHIGAVPATSKFNITFKFAPNGHGDGIGFLGGWTNWHGDQDVIFWNDAEQQFMIGAANGPVNATAVLSTKAVSPKLDLPTNEWTDVEFIYDGTYMAVKVNGVIVCSTNNAWTDYNYYIFYPSDVNCYVKDMKATWDGGSCDFNLPSINANAYQNVTLDSGVAIAEAEAAYANLSNAAKALVKNYDALVALRADYDALLNSTAGDVMIAEVVENMIASIGEVLYNPWDASTDSGAAIAAAETAYAGLSDAGKAAVSNYETLTAARAEYNAQIDAFNQAMAYDVDVLIDAIGEVNFESRPAIEAAEAAYAALNDAQKAYVTKYDVLVAARATYDQYAPIMAVEVLADAMGSDFFQGQYLYGAFTSSNGYAQLPGIADQNFTFTTTFVYTAADLHDSDDSNIGLFRSDASFAGYDFSLDAFIIGSGGAFMSGNKTPEVFAKTEYDLIPGKVYTMDIKFEGGVGSVYLDGELMVTGNGNSASGHSYAIFYPMNANIYFDSLSVNGTAMGQSDFVYGASIAGIDVLAPVNIQEKLEAAEAALAALDADQLALLDDKYETIIAEARANFDVKLAAIQADADAVEALIAAIKTEADANAARAAFQALTPGAQTLVENYEDLNNALVVITEGYIDAIGEVTPASENAIAAAEAAYYALTDAEKALVSNYDVLVAARNEITALNAAVVNAMTKINMLQAGGSAIVNNADGGSVGSYSQYEDNAKQLNGSNAVAEYAISFDVYVDRLNDETNAYIGGSSANEVFVGYDLVRKTVFVAKAGPWGYSSTIDAANIVAEAAFDLKLQTWYDFKFILGDTTAKIYVDGELVLETAITEPAGWFIYYPKNNVSYYDNIEFWYNGEKQTSMADFSKVGAGNWTALSPAGDPGYYLTTTAPLGPVDKTDADLIAAARAAYEAVPDKAKYAVANYDVLVAAEAPDVDVNAEAAAAVDALIADLGEITLDSADAVAAAREAYEALADEAKALVADLATLEAAEAALKALKAAADKAEIHDYILGKVPAVAPQNVATSVNDNKITITWDAVDGAAKYWVYVDGVCFLSTTGTSATIARPYGEYEITVQVALRASYGTAYAAGTSAPVTAVLAAPAPVFEITAAGVVDNKIQVEWNAAEGATKYWVVFTAENGTVYTFATTNTAFARKVAPFAGNYSVVVRALVAGKIVDTAAATFAC